LSIYHLEGTLNPGTHVLAVEGFNDNDQAGVILGFRSKWQTARLWNPLRPGVVARGPNSEAVGKQRCDRPAIGERLVRRQFWQGALVGNSGVGAPHPRDAAEAGLGLAEPRISSRLSRAAWFRGYLPHLLIQLVSQSKAHHLVQAERDRMRGTFMTILAPSSRNCC